MAGVLLAAEVGPLGLAYFALCCASHRTLSVQVLPIWEGATSVLCLDVLRVLAASPQAAAAFTHQSSARLAAALKAARGTGSTSTNAGGMASALGTSTSSTGSHSRAGSGIAGQDALEPGTTLRHACLALHQRLPVLGSRLQAAAAGASSPASQFGMRDLAFDLARVFVGGRHRHGQGVAIVGASTSLALPHRVKVSRAGACAAAASSACFLTLSAEQALAR